MMIGALASRQTKDRWIDRGLRALDEVKHCQGVMSERMIQHDNKMRTSKPLDWSTRDVELMEEIRAYVQSALHTAYDKGMERANKDQTKHDPVNHPSHYTSHPSGVECIRITRHMNFNRGNAIKYIWRCGDKGKPVEDLEKAIFYLKDEIERIKNK